MNKPPTAELEQYFKLKSQMQLPIKLGIYFAIFETLLNSNNLPKPQQTPKGFSKQLLNAFSKKSIEQKGNFLLNELKFIKNQPLRQQYPSLQPTIQHIQTTCQMKSSIMKISFWQEVSFKLDKIKLIILVTNKKKQLLIDLKNYFIRKSQKKNRTFVLESVTENVFPQYRKLQFLFDNCLFEQIYKQITELILSIRNEKLLPLIKDPKQQLLETQRNNKPLVFLNSFSINEYLIYKQQLIKKILQGKYDFQIVQSQNNWKIQKSSKVNNVYKLQSDIKMSSKQTKQKFFKSYEFYKFKQTSQVLQDFSKKYQAVYEKHIINNQLKQIVAIQQKTFAQTEQIFFKKGLQNIMSSGFIQFLLVKVRALSPNDSRLLIYVGIIDSSKTMYKIIKAYLVEFREMLDREYEINQGDNNDEEEFKTVVGQDIANGDDFDLFEADVEYQDNPIVEKNLIETNIKSSNLYLIKRAKTSPINNMGNPLLMKQHFLFKQWVRIKNGGVVCTNQEIIDLQKRLFKDFIFNMGNSIIKNKGLLNISMPVYIFKKQSHLTSIARNLSYAPLLFEKASNNSLERVKLAVIQVISVGTLGISMNKPFNPVLGETFQAWIHGCPIYLQQISHHPPIGAYFFQGRGYKIHGQIQPKISLGMNNVKGCSQRPNYIDFEDGTRIEMIYGKMIIKGLLFGQRQFNFQQKVYAYDITNHIFAVINYGPKHRSIMKNSQLLDFVWGKIYKLKPQFIEKFRSTGRRVYPSKEMIISELSQFEGYWTDELKFDGVTYINFKTNLPCQLIDQQYPLQSNAWYRSDLLKLIEGNLTEAQNQKQLVEEIQRRDRKLRQKYKK